MFANATYTSSMMGQWNLLAYMPFKKCNVKDDPDELSTIDEMHIETSNYISISGFSYSCEPSFNKTAKLPPEKSDDRCFTPEYIVSPNSANCSGDPYHTDFFHYSKTNE